MVCRQPNLFKTVCRSCLGLVGTTLAVSTVVSGMLVPAASAQEPQTVLESLEDIIENRSGSYFRNRSIAGQFRFITGIGGFPENGIRRDTESISAAYDELLILQTQNTPTLRVPDLPNPYTTSVQLLPASQFDSRIIGSELNFEPLPRR